MWHDIAQWLTTDIWGQFVFGVLGNLAASGLLFLLGGRWIWKKHLKPHIDKVHELHQHTFSKTHAEADS